MKTNAPHNPDKLIGSKWTRCKPENRRKHWEIVEYAADDCVILRAVMDGHTIERPWRALRNREEWEPGWS